VCALPGQKTWCSLMKVSITEIDSLLSRCQDALKPV
jgi:hypothetical protein